MAKHKHNDLEINQAMTTAVSFMESYNKTIPEGFPRVSLKALERFQAEHTSLFKNKNEWSIDKHRKKFMDWAISNQDVLES